MDYSWEAKFLIPKKDIRELFGDIKGEWKTNERFLITNIHSHKKWFNPDSIQSFKSIEVRYPQEHTVLIVLYDNSKANEDDLILCYLIWFELS